jgi:hypothetical protein
MEKNDQNLCCEVVRHGAQAGALAMYILAASQKEFGTESI